MLNGFAYCKMHLEQNQPQDFTYLDVNRAFETLTGLKHVVGRRVSEVIPGIRESDPEMFESFGRVALTGIPERFETFISALGIWFSIAVYSPRKMYFIAVFEVITERKRAEEARVHLAAIVESSQDAIIGKRLDGTILSWNQSAERLYGYPAQEMIGRSIGLLAPADLPDEMPGIMEKIKRGELVEHYETARVRKDGTRVFVSLSISPLRGPSDAIVGASSIALDITARREAERPPSAWPAR